MQSINLIDDSIYYIDKMETLRLRYAEIAGHAPYHCATTESRFLAPNLPFHRHDFEEVFLVTDGAIRHDLERQTSVTAKGTLHLIWSSDCHRIGGVRGQDGQFINTAFPAGTLKRHLGHLGHIHTQCMIELSEEDFGRLLPCFRWLSSQYLQNPKPDQLSVLLTTCLEVLCRPEPQPALRDHVDQAILDLDQLEFARAGLAGLLERTSVSLPHLCRTVKLRTGKTPTQVINEARLRQSRILLSRSNQSIDAIAFQVGFENAPYFHRLFRAQFNESPGQFRAKQRAVMGAVTG
jgi:AraC family transcriptional regulator, dual regulator of chb operon